MTSQKRKADAALLAEPDESPHKHKRASSENTNKLANKPNGTAHISDESLDKHVEHSITPADPLSHSPVASDAINEAASLSELPQSWDQADAADKMLFNMKEKIRKIPWARIEQAWERLTGERPAKGILPDRYRRLKEIVAHVNAGSADGKSVEPKFAEQPSEATNDMSNLPTATVRPPSAEMSGPSDKHSSAVSKLSDITVKPLEGASGTPTHEVDPEQDLPQSWEQANAGDQLIMRMKHYRTSWSKIKEAWQRLTGERPAEGVLEDRYTRIKELVFFPGTDGAYTQKRTPRNQRKPKTEPEHSEHESSEVSSDEISKHSMPMARRNPRGAAERQMRASAFDGPSEEPAGSSDELDGASQHSTTVAKSAKRPRVKPAVATKSGAQDTAETADEMVLEMRERGCTWPEITEAWNERTGFSHVPETLRKRYARIKGSSATKPKPTAPAPSKRKVKGMSPEEDSYDSAAKRRKSTAEISHSIETPIKCNMNRGKRKSSIKYTESTTDEDELFAAPVESVATAPPKRNAGRSAKVNRSDPEWLVTNEKSPLAYEDLHAELSDPKTYHSFTKSDWEDLREILPSDVPINSDGYSIPITFFKYDPDFRRGIREFQEDLSSGRLDPKWQADAAQAMEERARGEFDVYKENQFEAFWGQKQKLSHDALAGESTKIKLDLLIQNDIFKVGDYFSYSRVVGRGKSGVLVEKDCKIVMIDGKELIFAIPPGRRKYSRHMFESETPGNTKPEPKATMACGDEQPPTSVDSKSGAAQVVTDAETNGGKASEASEKHDEAMIVEQTAKNGNLPDGIKAQEVRSNLENKEDEIDAGESKNLKGTEIDAKNTPQENEIPDSTVSEESNLKGASTQTNGDQSSTPAFQEEDILHRISGLKQLESKIIDIDGRFNSKDLGTINTWKAFRGLRKNQDLGTLFEIREDFYVYKHPQIVKEPKKKR